MNTRAISYSPISTKYLENVRRKKEQKIIEEKKNERRKVLKAVSNASTIVLAAGMLYFGVKCSSQKNSVKLADRTREMIAKMERPEHHTPNIIKDASEKAAERLDKAIKTIRDNEYDAQKVIFGF